MAFHYIADEEAESADADGNESIILDVTVAELFRETAAGQPEGSDIQQVVSYPYC